MKSRDSLFKQTARKEAIDHDRFVRLWRPFENTYFFPKITTCYLLAEHDFETIRNYSLFRFSFQSRSTRFHYFPRRELGFLFLICHVTERSGAQLCQIENRIFAKNRVKWIIPGGRLFHVKSVCVCVCIASVAHYLRKSNKLFQRDTVEADALTLLIGKGGTLGTVTNCMKNTFLTPWNLKLRTWHVSSPTNQPPFFRPWKTFFLSLSLSLSLSLFLSLPARNKFYFIPACMYSYSKERATSHKWFRVSPVIYQAIFNYK